VYATPPPFFIFVFIFVLVAVPLYRHFRKVRGVEEQDGPLLASTEMLQDKDLQSLAKGRIETFDYSLMINDSGRVMVFVDLGHNTNMHLIATGDESRVVDIVASALSNKWLIPISLEGDFPDYFKVYASPEKEVEVREIFDPETMANFEDFCREFDFEIYDDQLFISQGETQKTEDNSESMVKAVEQFLQINYQLISKFLI